MEMFGLPIIDPESDEGKYRLACYRLITGNKEKYPEINNFLEIERRTDTTSLLISLTLLGAEMGKSFRKNEPIAECARHLEELHRIGREQAEVIYAEHVKAMEKGTIH